MVMGWRMTAAGLRVALSRWVTAMAPRCSALVPNSCMWRRVSIATCCTGETIPKGMWYCW